MLTFVLNHLNRHQK